MVIGLGFRPSVCFGQILKSSDEIRSGNGFLAFGTKKFRNLALLHSEVEIRGSIGSSGSRGGGDVYVALSGGVAGVVVIGVDIDVGIVEVVVLRCQIDIIGSSVSRRYLVLVEALNFFLRRSCFCFLTCPQIVCFDLACIIGFVVISGAVF